MIGYGLSPVMNTAVQISGKTIDMLNIFKSKEKRKELKLQKAHAEAERLNRENADFLECMCLIGDNVIAPIEFVVKDNTVVLRYMKYDPTIGKISEFANKYIPYALKHYDRNGLKKAREKWLSLRRQIEGFNFEIVKKQQQ